MLLQNDFAWIGEHSETKAANVEIEYVYSSSFKVWIKDPELDMKPCPVLCFKGYKVTFPSGKISRIEIADYLSERNVIEMLWTQCPEDQLHVLDICYGELTREI
jgi:hypothetical protein